MQDTQGAKLVARCGGARTGLVANRKKGPSDTAETICKRTNVHLDFSPVCGRVRRVVVIDVRDALDDQRAEGVDLSFKENQAPVQAKKHATISVGIPHTRRCEGTRHR